MWGAVTAKIKGSRSTPSEKSRGGGLERGKAKPPRNVRSAIYRAAKGKKGRKSVHRDSMAFSVLREKVTKAQTAV